MDEALGYSAAGDLVRQINPDATTLNWTYDSTLHRLLTAEDEMARQTVYTYSTSGNGCGPYSARD